MTKMVMLMGDVCIPHMSPGLQPCPEALLWIAQFIFLYKKRNENVGE